MRRSSQTKLNPFAKAFVPSRYLEQLHLEMGQTTSDRTHPVFENKNHQYFQIGIPTFSNGLTTFAYQQVLRNRIPESKLRKHAEYDVESYTPTFIHDCLMLPGSLANLLEKVTLLRVARTSATANWNRARTRHPTSFQELHQQYFQAIV